MNVEKSKKFSNSHRNKISIALKGRKLSEEHIEKIRIKAKIRLSIPENNPMFAKRGILSPNYNKKCTEETKRKIKLSNIKFFKEHSEFRKGKNNSFFNKHHTKETKKKWNRKLKNNPNWKNGKSFEEYGKDFDSSLKEQIRFRDKYTCKLCGCSQLENGRQLDCHHIDYNKDNNNIINLVSLCIKCHLKTNGNRKYWMEFLNGKI